MGNSSRMVTTHCQTVFSRFEDVRTCTYRRIDNPRVGNTGRRPKRWLGGIRVQERVDSDRTMMLFVWGVCVVVGAEDDHCLSARPVQEADSNSSASSMYPLHLQENFKSHLLLQSSRIKCPKS